MLKRPPPVEEIIDTVESKADDFFDTVVPLSERKSDFTMGLLWITMMSGFPVVLFGFEWYKEGFTLAQVLASTVTGAVIFFLFTFCSAWIGVQTGLSYSVLCRNIFGTRGSQIISTVWSVLFLLWYGLNAVLFADALRGLFHVNWSLPVAGAIFTVLMAFNTAFGFKGVSNFARYFAAPIIVVWIFSTFFKAAGATSLTVFHAHSHQPWSYSLAVISSLVIGGALWGNDSDFWRFGKSSFSTTGLWIALAILIGQVIFPTTGWLMANISGITDSAGGTDFLNKYSFGGSSWIAAIVLGASYFALNDGNLYGAINGLENIWMHQRKLILAGAVAFSALAAVILAPMTGALDSIAALNAIILPCVTLIIAFEYFAAPKLWAHGSHSEAEYRANFYTPATIALICGWVVGVFSAGVVPQVQTLHTGIWPLYAWGTAVAVFIGLRCIAQGRFDQRETLLGIFEDAQDNLTVTASDRD